MTPLQHQCPQLGITAGFCVQSISALAAVREAKDYLRGAALTPQQAKDLVIRLKNEDRFGWARRALAKVREANVGNSELRTWFSQQHVLCTYKDPDLPILTALDQALAILSGSFDLENTSDQETLGIAGAIHKRRWQATGQRDQLERSYHYYRRGYDVGPEKDRGYTAINAAWDYQEFRARRGDSTDQAWPW
jgi:hypothetical protein